jgi:hypothetical protein
VIFLFEKLSINTPEIIPKIITENVSTIETKDTKSFLVVKSYNQTGIINNNAWAARLEEVNARNGNENLI